MYTDLYKDSPLPPVLADAVPVRVVRPRRPRHDGALAAARAPARDGVRPGGHAAGGGGGAGAESAADKALIR